MRHIIIIILLISSFSSLGQTGDKWQLSFQLQPELTFHKNQYSYRWKEKYTTQTFNVGLASSIHYNLTDRIFIEGGLAFISRKLTAKAFLDHSLLPPPYKDSTDLLRVAQSITLRTLQLPIGIGVNIIRMEKLKFFVKGMYIPSFLLNTKYDVNNYPSFKKNHWQGYSINASLGMDYQLNNKIALTSSLAYSLANTVNKDQYLYSQDQRPIALPHTYLQLSMGMKINIK